MMRSVRTTVDLPSGVHRRVRELAAERKTSVSAVISELTARALAELGTPATVQRSAVTGLPVLSIGRVVTNDDVARALDDE